MSGRLPKPSDQSSAFKNRSGNIVRECFIELVLFGGKRVSDEKYYVNGFFESP